VIKRNGTDGSTFPMVNEECLLGRGEGCDIRIQLPVVSKEHARLRVTVSSGQVFLTSLSRTNATKLNDAVLQNEVPTLLSHSDVFTIGDRHFRWEFPKVSPHFTCPDPDPVEEPMDSLPAPVPQEMGVTKRLAEMEAESMTPMRKRVSFGPAVTPELIDKTLPPDTPVRKGSVPSNLGGGQESPRPDAGQRSASIRRTVAKRVSARPPQAGIPEELSPTRGLLKRPAGFDPSEGTTQSRASPRTSPTKVPRIEVTPSTPVPMAALAAEVSVMTTIRDMVFLVTILLLI